MSLGRRDNPGGPFEKPCRQLALVDGLLHRVGNLRHRCDAQPWSEQVAKPPALQAA